MDCPESQQVLNLVSLCAAGKQKENFSLLLTKNWFYTLTRFPHCWMCPSGHQWNDHQTDVRGNPSSSSSNRRSVGALHPFLLAIHSAGSSVWQLNAQTVAGPLPKSIFSSWHVRPYRQQVPASEQHVFKALTTGQRGLLRGCWVNTAEKE